MVLSIRPQMGIPQISVPVTPPLRPIWLTLPSFCMLAALHLRELRSRCLCVFRPRLCGGILCSWLLPFIPAFSLPPGASLCSARVSLTVFPGSAFLVFSDFLQSLLCTSRHLSRVWGRNGPVGCFVVFMVTRLDALGILSYAVHTV